MTPEELTLLQKIQQAKTIAPDWQSPIQHRRDLYHFNHYTKYPSKLKQGETRYADPTYTNTVDLAVGILHSNDFRWHVYGWTPSLSDTSDSSSIEKYLAGTLHVNSLREEEDIRLEITQSFVRDGVAIIYTVWDPKEAEAHLQKVEELDPESKDVTVTSKVYMETPIVTKVINPLSMYLLPGGNNRWSSVMRAEQMTVWDVEQTYEAELERFKADTDADKRETMIEFIDYWEIERVKGKNVVRNAFVADGIIIKPLEIMQGYEQLPYTIGFFTNDMNDDPKHWVKGLVDVLENSVEMLEKGINRRQALIDRFTGLPMLVQTKPGRSVELDSSMNATKIEEGEDVKFPTWPGNPPDVDAQLDLFRSRIQQSGFSESMYGSASGKTGSGYAISQESDQNRIRLTQPVANLQLFWTLWAKKVLTMTQNFAKKSKVRVYGRVRGSDFVTLVPGKDTASYIVECKIRPDFPQEKTRKHAMATQAAGVLSQETLMTEYYDIEQPDDEKKRRLIEVAQQNPAMQQYALILNLQEMAKNGDEAAKLSLDIVKSQIPKPAPAQAGPKPEQAQGLQSSTGAATPQAGGMPPPGQSAQDQMSQQVGASPNMQGGV